MPEPRSPARRFRFRPLGCLLAAAAVLVLTPVLGIGIYVSQSSGRAAKALAAVQAAGEPITADELEAYYALPPGAEDPAPLWLAAIAPLESPEYKASARDLPIVGIGGEVPPPDEPWDQNNASTRHLATYSAYLHKMHEAARVGGAARYPTDFHSGMGMRLPHGQGLRQAARLLELDARVKAREGDAHAAAESLHALLAAAESLEREPISTSQMTRIALPGIAIAALEDLLPHIEFSEEDLAMLQADLMRADYRDGLRRALLGERWLGVSVFQTPEMFDSPMFGPTKANSITSRLTRRDDLVFYLECMDRYIAAAKKPWPQARKHAEAVTQAFEAEINQSVAGDARYAVTAFLLPAMDAMFEACCRAQARGEAAAAALAVERYRLKHGQLPEKLSQLVPDFLTAPPIDPYDGKPLRYLGHEGHITVFSVGRDGLDDGGVEVEQTAKPDVAFIVRSRQAR